MSNDVSIQVFNKTDDQELYICVFQKPEEANPNEIYTTLFPTAWKILALGPNQTSDPIIYPIQLQMSVTESQDAKAATNRTTFQDCDEGQIWSFERPGMFSDVTLKGGKTPEGEVVIQNNSQEKVDIGLAKNGTNLVVKKNVIEGDQAVLQLTPTLYFLAASDLQKGDLIRSDDITEKAFALSLTNLASADVVVSTADHVSGKLAWAATNKVSV